MAEQTSPRADYAPTGTDDTSSGTFATLKRTVKEFQEDNMSDWAAALTYYGLLSLFPALIALVSIIGLFGDPQKTTQTITDMVTQLGPQSAADTFAGPVKSITANRGAAGILFFVGLGLSLWSASGYIGAFMRASNIVYETPEGRPFWKLRPLQLLVTLVMILLLAAVLLGLVLSGPVVSAVAGPLGIGSTAQTVFNIAKWPIMLIAVILMFAVLFHAAPNVKLPGFKWVTPGRDPRARRVDRRVGRVRVLRRQLRLLRQDLRGARRRGDPADVDVADQRRAAARDGAQRRARAVARARRGRAARRARDPARAARRAEGAADDLTRPRPGGRAPTARAAMIPARCRTRSR